MFTKSLIIFLAVTAMVVSHDISVGTNTNGRKIFDETKQASPAIWRQTNNVTVKANADEVISQVVVKDLRAEKDGDAKIVEGGEGQKNVTIELKSPTALRGYDFQIEVYAVPDTNKDKSPQNDVKVNMDDMTNHPKDTGFNMDKTTNTNVPTVVSKDDINRSTRNANEDNKDQQPGLKIPFPVNEYSTIKPEDCSTEMSLEDILNKENMKTAKDAQEHEIVEFVLDMNDSAKEALKDGQSMASDDMTPMELKSNSTDEKERLSRDASTTESSDIESTTNNESTVISEVEKESKDDKVKPINQEFLYSKQWNGQNNEDLPKVPFVSTRDESNTKMKDSDSKNVKLHLK